MADDKAYAYWKAALAWRANPKANKMPDFDKAHPESGFYRGQRNEAVAIWWVNDTCLAQVHRPNRTGSGMTADPIRRGADAISDGVFSYCCRHPITYPAFQEVIAKGVWPEDVSNVVGFVPPKSSPATNGKGTDQNDSRTEGPAPETEQPSTPEGVFSREIDLLVASAEAWLDTLPQRKITEQTHADRVANYATVAQNIEDRAEAARKAEKQPLDEQVKAIQARWNPVVSRAGKIKQNLKTILTPFLSAAKARALQEAAEAQKEREAATLAGEAAPLASARPSQSVAGTQGRVSLKTRPVYDINDLRAAAEFLAKMNKPPEDFVVGVLSSAKALIKAGIEVPGITVRTEEYSA